MTGSLSQSYFIFDAQEYKVGRKIYYGIEVEEEVVDELGDLLNDGEDSHCHGHGDSSSGSESSDETHKSEARSPVEPKPKRNGSKMSGGPNNKMKINKVGIN